MTLRLPYWKHSPGAYQAMMEVEKALHAGGVDHKLLHLLKLRVSQINGCAYCIDMHWKDCRAAGESEQRLYSLDCWRECPWYTEPERAVLAWAEAITCIADPHVAHAMDPLYDAVRAHFDEQQTSDITWAIASINAWNRMGIALRSEPGRYQPPKARGQQH